MTLRCCRLYLIWPTNPSSTTESTALWQYYCGVRFGPVTWARIEGWRSPVVSLLPYYSFHLSSPTSPFPSLTSPLTSPLPSLFTPNPPHPAPSTPDSPLANLTAPPGNTHSHPTHAAYAGVATLTSLLPLSTALMSSCASEAGGTRGARKEARGGGGMCANRGVARWPGVARMREIGA